MTKQSTLFILLSFVLGLNAQTVADFENFGLTAGEYLNNAENGVFVSGNASLQNDYNEEGMYWQGWAISATTDTQTPGFLNQYSAYPGGGAEGSLSYALSYAFNPQIIQLTGDAVGAPVDGLYLTNTTYAYLGMLNGVGPAKAFGGPTGDDPDYLLLTIHGYANGVLTVDSVDFYLGDYRFEDNSQDYLVDEWTWVDLTSLGNVDSLRFSITGSDVGEFGLNTPAYVCLDQLTTSDMPVNTRDLNFATDLRIWPNPTVDQVQLSTATSSTLSLFNAQGIFVEQWSLAAGQHTISLRNLPAGTYYMRQQSADHFAVHKLIKQ